MKDLFLFIYLLSTDNRNKHNPDQAVYNLILTKEPFKDIVGRRNHCDDSFAVILGCSLTENYKKVRLSKNCDIKYDYATHQVLNSETNEPYCIVHQYDRSEYNDDIKTFYR